MKNTIEEKYSLDLHWPTINPFLFCAYHNDAYPAGNENFQLDQKHLTGRNLGSDFTLKDGFRLYHGFPTPGFPMHPHRGFETVTIVLDGLVDHADSFGGAARYGQGDVQWMSAASGIQHSEMFPLLNQNGSNDLKLFQIWLNLPAVNKMNPPEAKIFWSGKIPKKTIVDQNQNKIKLKVIAGTYPHINQQSKTNQNDHIEGLEPPKNSWAHDKENQVQIWLIELSENSEFELPEIDRDSSAMLYNYQGEVIKINEENLGVNQAARLNLDEKIIVKNSHKKTHLLFLSAKPISEPVVQRGPFVMNTDQEIHDAIHEYQSSQFGGWPWPNADQTHGEKPVRYMKDFDGKIISPE